MSPIGSDEPGHDPALELRRIVTRLSSLGPARITRPRDDGSAPIDVVRPALQALADEAADAEDRPRRAVPELAAHGLADQLIVLTNDLLAAAPGREAEVVARLAELRRAL